MADDAKPTQAPLRAHPRLRWGLFVLALLLGVGLDLGTKAYAFAELPDIYQCETHPEVAWSSRVYESAARPCHKCQRELVDRRSVEITSWFAFTRATNPGAAFGMFRGQHAFFMVVTIAAFVALPFFVHTARRKPLAGAVLLGLILAGVFGNFWDRILFNEVRDFLDFHTPGRGSTWPTFNVADMFITGGAIIILTSQFFMKEIDEEPTEGDSEAEATAEPEPASEAETEPEAEAEAEAKTDA